MNFKTKKYFRFAFSLATAALLATAIFIIPISSFADSTSTTSQGGTIGNLNTTTSQGGTTGNLTTGSNPNATNLGSVNSNNSSSGTQSGTVGNLTTGSNPNATNLGSVNAVNPSTNVSSAASCGTDSTICNPIANGTVNDIPSLIVLVIKYLVALIGIVAVLMIIIGGYQMVTSAGNEEGYKKAKQTITYAVIGLVIAVLSYSVAAIVENTLGANLGTPATSSVSSSSSTSGTPSPVAGTPAATTNGSSSTGSNGTNGTSGNTAANQVTPIPGSSPKCTAASMEGINIVIIDPTPVYVDPTNGGSVQYEITPDNDVAAGCQVSVDTYILEGSDSWNSSLQANDTASSLNTPNTLDIPEQYSQDPSVTLYSRFTDSTGVVKDTYTSLNLTETAPSTGAGSNCTAAAMEGINIVIIDPTPVTMDPSNGGSVQYEITPDNDVAAGCQVSVDTYILEGSDSWNSSLQANDTASSLNTPNTLDIPEQYSQDPSITLYSRFTDSTGAVKDTYASLSLTQTSQNSSNTNDNSSDTSNDGSSDNGGSYDGGD